MDKRLSIDNYLWSFIVIVIVTVFAFVNLVGGNDYE